MAKTRTPAEKALHAAQERARRARKGADLARIQAAERALDEAHAAVNRERAEREASESLATTGRLPEGDPRRVEDPVAEFGITARGVEHVAELTGETPEQVREAAARQGFTVAPVEDRCEGLCPTYLDADGAPMRCTRKARHMHDGHAVCGQHRNSLQAGRDVRFAATR